MAVEGRKVIAEVLLGYRGLWCDASNSVQYIIAAIASTPLMDGMMFKPARLRLAPDEVTKSYLLAEHLKHPA